MIGLAVSISVYSWRRLGSRAGTLVAAVALALLIALAPSRLGMLMNLDEVSAQGRIQAWTAGLDMLKAHPLTGVGWDGYLRLHARSAHNSFLHAFGELGLLGGFCFVAIVYSYFWGLRWRSRKDGPAVASLSNWEDALYSAGAGFFVDAFFLSQQYSVMTFTVVALAAVYVSIAKKAGPVVFGPRQWLSVAGATAAILGVIWLGVRLLVVRSG
jgi:O-antigen ligase